MSVAPDIDKAELFGELGYGAPERCAQLVAEAGLSRRGRRRVARTKVPRIEALLRSCLVRTCNRGDCRRAGRRTGRELAPARTQGMCEVCGGSVLARRVDEMVAVCLTAGRQRICVVGGSPNSRVALTDCVAGRLDLRLREGTVKRSGKQARADVAWAHLVVVWGPTLLDHAVSAPYMHHPHSVNVQGRGIEHVVVAVVDHLRERGRAQ